MKKDQLNFKEINEGIWELGGRENPCQDLLDLGMTADQIQAIALQVGGIEAISIQEERNSLQAKIEELTRRQEALAERLKK